MHSATRMLSLHADDVTSRTLAAADPALGAVIHRVGAIERGPYDTGFPIIARSIVAQQLSEKVAPKIWARVVDNVGITPEALAVASPQTLRDCGLSWRKVDYLQGIARATLTGEIDWDGLDSLPDEDVIAELSRLRGVGRWTAEMYLIFALGRPDVLALDDLGVRISAGKMLGLGRAATREELAERSERWQPYRSTASLWLWADGG